MRYIGVTNPLSIIVGLAPIYFYRMNYTDEEIQKYYDKEEYAFCLDKMYSSLRTLKFDIIKDKGVPITEDIYIEIWMEDNGKLKNWTD